MEYPDVVAYKKKQEKEYIELLARSDKLKELIEESKRELERLEKAKIIIKKEIIGTEEGLQFLAQYNSQKRNLVKIKELGNIILELKGEISLLKERKQEPDTKEIKAFKDKLNKEYEEAKESREDILKQVEAEEKKSAELKKNQEVKILGLDELIAERNKELLNIKKEKEAFLKSLEQKEEKIEGTLYKVAEKEIELSEELSRQKELKKMRENELKELEIERKELKERNKIIGEKEWEFENKTSVLNDKISNIEKIEKQTQENYEYATREKKRLLENAKELLLREEAVKKAIRGFEDREAEIAKEKKHLESQQETLRLAFQELRDKRK